MVAQTTDVMDRLREETRDLHTAAENHPIQKAQVSGTLPKQTYVTMLGQMYHVHRVLEQHLRRHNDHYAVAAVVRDFQYQEPYIVADLEFFGVDPATVEPLPATRRLIARFDALAHDPLALLGMHYVLEGSNNGSKFIAKAVKHGYGLHDGRGMTYLDPYGDDQRENWATFKRDMSAIELTDQEIDHMVESAKALFAALPAIFDDLEAGV